MSIRPMDFQVLYPKTTELSKTYTDEVNRNQVVSQQQAEANRDRIDHSLKQVVARENIQHGVVVKEKQQRDNNSQNDKNKKKQNRNNNEERSKIDIRI